MKPIVGERRGTKGPWKRFYLYTPGGALLASLDPQLAKPVRFYHFDAQGNTLLLTDGDGNITDIYAYTPYGRQIGSGSTSDQPFTFVGRWGVRQESGTGTLYQMRARYFDVVTSAFLSRDPLPARLADPHSLNPYEYARRDPISYSDPWGTDPEDAAFRFFISFLEGDIPEGFLTGGPFLETNPYSPTSWEYDVFDTTGGHPTYEEWDQAFQQETETGVHYTSAGDPDDPGFAGSEGDYPEFWRNTVLLGRVHRPGYRDEWYTEIDTLRAIWESFEDDEFPTSILNFKGAWLPFGTWD
jgi:RHS repeat-associated protein